ncbi:Chaperonin CPN60-like 2, mitochondrial [Dendrobium catenatum]|uniref:Chaperonin CPN60-like 2, mitochondrial n=1 Tax=Dendrobium catenatum TaxID=906689 RepID=A0A2I0W815_9ASPA|nr:Chaperonin CPN60-like 2, mitochondrial [Dendrobium catenatum]
MEVVPPGCSGKLAPKYRRIQGLSRGKFTKEEYLFGVKGPGDSTASGKVEVITEDHDLTLSNAQLEMLGTAKKVTVSLDDTVILHGSGDKKLIEDRCE